MALVLINGNSELLQELRSVLGISASSSCGVGLRSGRSLRHIILLVMLSSLLLFAGVGLSGCRSLRHSLVVCSLVLLTVDSLVICGLALLTVVDSLAIYCLPEKKYYAGFKYPETPHVYELVEEEERREARDSAAVAALETANYSAM